MTWARSQAGLGALPGPAVHDPWPVACALFLQFVLSRTLTGPDVRCRLLGDMPPGRAAGNAALGRLPRVKSLLLGPVVLGPVAERYVLGCLQLLLFEDQDLATTQKLTAWVRLVTICIRSAAADHSQVRGLSLRSVVLLGRSPFVGSSALCLLLERDSVR